MKYKLFIPSAGLGVRLGNISQHLNKALVSIDNKPSISHVIEKFNKDIEIVIALGHKGDLLRDYLEIAHSDRNITYVNIKNFSGTGSGLGLTILECMEHLQCPFIFCPNDSIIIDDIPKPDFNWMGYADVHYPVEYRCIGFHADHNVYNIFEKKDIYNTTKHAYIGLAGIKDYEQFWNFMVNGKDYGSIKIGESYGLREMITNNIIVKAKKFDWHDTGNLDSLKKTRQYLKSKNAPEVLEKANADIWLVNNKVIKYNSDEKFIHDRVERSKILKGYVPNITEYKNNMYCYKMLTGQTMSKNNTFENFKRLLNYLSDFWSNPIGKVNKSDFKKKCVEFYKHKTFDRLKLYFDKTDNIDSSEIVNDIPMPSVYELLDRVDWDNLCEGKPSLIHGDLHFENILVSETGDFTLLDWRQNFAGIKEYGDLYYDLAKIMHGLIVSHEIINKDLYNVEKTDDIIRFDFHRKYSLVKNEQQFIEFLHAQNMDLQKVNILTALIYLNIAPLHHFPYSELLFYLGKSKLFEEVNNESY